LTARLFHLSSFSFQLSLGLLDRATIERAAGAMRLLADSEAVGRHE
jgi:hypothetical protein